MLFCSSESLCQLRYAIYGGQSADDECPGERFDYKHAKPMFEWIFTEITSNGQISFCENKHQNLKRVMW